MSVRYTPGDFADACARTGTTPEAAHRRHARCKPRNCRSLWVLPMLPGDPRWAEHLDLYPKSAALLPELVRP